VNDHGGGLKSEVRVEEMTSVWYHIKIEIDLFQRDVMMSCVMLMPGLVLPEGGDMEFWGVGPSHWPHDVLI
jgi:hypothetical protein